MVGTGLAERAFAFAERLAEASGRGADGSPLPRSSAVAFPDHGGRSVLIGHADEAAALRILGAVAAEQRGWAAVPLEDRVAAVRSFAAGLAERGSELAGLIVLESGKALRYAEKEVQYALETVESLCEAAEGLAPVAAVGSPEVRVTRRPVGTALLVAPWNFPFSLPLRKAISALLAGCTFLLKPSERTPLCSLAIVEILRQSIPGPVIGAALTTSDSRGVVGALLEDPRIRKLSFTGSTEVGRALQRQAAERLVRTSLELGGNAPFVLAPSADPVEALPHVLTAKFGNSGQACTALNRLYVPQESLGRVLGLLRAGLSALSAGDPLAPDTEVGPLISARAAESIRELIRDAEAGGAEVWRAPAERAYEDERFVPPTLVSGVVTGDRIAQQEVFGPVLTVIGYDGVDDAIAQANDTPYGLAAYVAGRDEGEVDALVSGIEAGMIAVNSGSVSSAASPFGGVGASGLGRENGLWGLQEFTEVVAELRR